jgi:hypothetical protein
MMRFARLEDGFVVEILPSADFPPELIPENGDVRGIYHPDFSRSLIDITHSDPIPQIGDPLPAVVEAQND